MRKISRIFAFVLVLAFLIPNFASAATVAPAEEGIIDRLEGTSRYTTAVEISKEAYTEADTVILASGTSFPDALAGTPLAAVLEAPILLTEKDNVRPEVLAEIERLGAENVILLGGELVISKAVEDVLKEKYEVERLDGKNRAETAALIGAKVVAKHEKKTAILVSGHSFADGLSVGPAAALAGYPIVFAEADKLPAETLAALKAWGISNIVVVGGNLVVSEEVETELKKDYKVERVSGGNRRSTALAVAKKWFADYETVLLATGEDFADALAGGPLAVKKGAPILLADKDKLGEEAEGFLNNLLTKVYVLGGPLAISEEIEEEVEEAVEKEPEVKAVSAINVEDVAFGGEVDLPETVEATLNDDTVVTLDITWTADEDYDATEAGDYTFEYVLSIQEDEELEFELPEELAEGTITVTVKTLLETATEAVEKAEGSLLNADIEAAQLLVDEVDDLVEAAKLQVRLNNLEPQILAIVKVVNNARSQIALLTALEPFENVNPDYIVEYEEQLGDAVRNFETIDEIQAVIDGVNDTKAAEEAAAVDALIGAFTQYPEEITEDYIAKVEKARAAYDSLTPEEQAFVKEGNVAKLIDVEGKIAKDIDEKLTAAKAKTTDLVEEEYTEESWTEATPAIEAAQELPEVTQKEKMAKTKALNEAFDKLVTIVQEVDHLEVSNASIEWNVNDEGEDYNYYSFDTGLTEDTELKFGNLATYTVSLFNGEELVATNELVEEKFAAEDIKDGKAVTSPFWLDPADQGEAPEAYWIQSKGVDPRFDAVDRIRIEYTLEDDVHVYTYEEEIESFKGLVLAKVELNNLVNKAKAFDKEKFDGELVTELDEALALPETTQDEVNTKVEALKDAIAKFEAAEAEAAVVVAENPASGPARITQAQALIDILPESAEKDALQARLDAVIAAREAAAQKEQFINSISVNNSNKLRPARTDSGAIRGRSVFVEVNFKEWNIKDMTSLEVTILMDNERLSTMTLKDPKNHDGSLISGSIYENATETGSWTIDKNLDLTGKSIGDVIFDGVEVKVVIDGETYIFTE